MKKAIDKLNENKIFFAIILASFIIGIFIFLSFSSYNPPSSTGNLIKEIEGTKLVTKIIDGDTVIIEGGYSVRLLGIDADEKGYPCYFSAKERIEELVLNKEVYLEADKEDQDQYKRYLRYLILGGENINLKLVKEGLAIARFSPENTKYKEEIINAEKEARENKIGCKWGENQAKGTGEETILPSSPIDDAIGACNAGNYIGEEKTVAGKIADGYKSNSNTVFLNFEKPYPNQCFTAVIFSSDLINFPENPQSFYEGKIVKVKGVIKEYQGKPEIILKYRSEIEIVT
jgi:micrococcal nuclease